MRFFGSISPSGVIVRFLGLTSLSSVIMSSRKVLIAAAPLPVNYEFESACMACVNQNPSNLLDFSIASIKMYSFGQQECITLHNITDPVEDLRCPPLQRCCFGIECCVTDGCRAPTDVFYFETQETGDFSQNCDECCDHIVPENILGNMTDSISSFPITDVTQLFGDCNSAATDNHCEMSVHYAGHIIQMNVQVDGDASTGSTAVVSAVFSSDIQTVLPMIKQTFVTNSDSLLEGLDAADFGPNIKSCSNVQSYAMHQHELLLDMVEEEGGVDGSSTDEVFPYFKDLQGSLCNTYGKSLIYYAARQWLNFTEVEGPSAIGTDGAFMYQTENLSAASPFVQLCQKRSFNDRQSFDATLSIAERGAESGERTTWYNTLVQEECVSTYAYPPSCPKCAMCSKHDELSALQLIQMYGQVEENRLCSKTVCEDILGQNSIVSSSEQRKMLSFVENDSSVCEFEGKPDSCECFCMRLAPLLKRCPHLQETFADKKFHPESMNSKDESGAASRCLRSNLILSILVATSGALTLLPF